MNFQGKQQAFNYVPEIRKWGKPVPLFPFEFLSCSEHARRGKSHERGCGPDGATTVLHPNQQIRLSGKGFYRNDGQLASHPPPKVHQSE